MGQCIQEWTKKNIFKGYLQQVLLDPFLNTLSYIFYVLPAATSTKQKSSKVIFSLRSLVKFYLISDFANWFWPINQQTIAIRMLYNPVSLHETFKTIT